MQLVSIECQWKTWNFVCAHRIPWIRMDFICFAGPPDGSNRVEWKFVRNQPHRTCLLHSKFCAWCLVWVAFVLSERGRYMFRVCVAVSLCPDWVYPNVFFFFWLCILFIRKENSFVQSSKEKIEWDSDPKKNIQRKYHPMVIALTLFLFNAQ